ncbi:hypothetical protein LNTAR_18805 [Lentisphaera araneosa HTCC2155]|jgi:YbbR domain-containing protein|uniref:YbbR-like protein n=1 Tax=Lentisphaera araneosa HTCC2155 TaxID=313628 RepID=A6DNR7_9BACT|nr:hypothetical protein [Lentisphaera araneosa]EDM26726.1 hypothetical protein LNTAR_18805 [Lentisphaera araneosa HTCC2155]
MKSKLIVNLFTNDFQRKLIAIFFALLIWFIVNERISKVQTFSGIPITLVNPNSNIILSKTNQPTANIILRGPNKILQSLESKDITVRLTIPEGVRPGTLKLLLTEDDITIPHMTQIENIISQTIIVEVDEMREKEVPVRLLFNNAISDKYRLINTPTIEPKTKLINGPSQRLDSINYLTTKPFLIDSSRDKSFVSSVSLSLPSGIKADFDKVKVIVDIESASKLLPMRRQKLSVMSPGQTIQVDLPFVDAVISGPPTTIDKLKANEVKFFIEKSDDDKLKVHFWCPYDEVYLQSVMPEYISNPWIK